MQQQQQQQQQQGQGQPDAFNVAAGAAQMFGMAQGGASQEQMLNLGAEFGTKIAGGAIDQFQGKYGAGMSQLWISLKCVPVPPARRAADAGGHPNECRARGHAEGAFLACGLGSFLVLSTTGAKGTTLRSTTRSSCASFARC